MTAANMGKATKAITAVSRGDSPACHAAMEMLQTEVRFLQPPLSHQDGHVAFVDGRFLRRRISRSLQQWIDSPSPLRACSFTKAHTENILSFLTEIFQPTPFKKKNVISIKSSPHSLEIIHQFAGSRVKQNKQINAEPKCGIYCN